MDNTKAPALAQVPVADEATAEYVGRHTTFDCGSPVPWYTEGPDCPHAQKCVRCMDWEATVHESVRLVAKWAQAIFDLSVSKIPSASDAIGGLTFAIWKLATEIEENTRDHQDRRAS